MTRLQTGALASGGGVAYLGNIVAAQHKAAASTVLLHCAPQAVLGLRTEPINLVQNQHLETPLTLQINGPTFGHVLSQSVHISLSTVLLQVLCCQCMASKSVDTYGQVNQARQVTCRMSACQLHNSTECMVEKVVISINHLCM